MLRQHLRISWLLALSLTLFLAIGGPTALCPAATITYGNFGPVPPGISFLDVKESSGTDPVPLFGPPDPFVIGLDFDPTNFVSTANGGGIDVTDGQLNFIVTGTNAFPINAVNLFEAGDYTLAGTGTAATQSIAAAILRATVTQINGINVAPINLVASNASVAFNLAANPGILQPWSLGLGLSIAGQLGPNQRATRVEISIDNQLLTFSQQASLAFIAKKEFQVNVGTIPEPGTMLLALGCCIGAGSLARRRTR